MDLPGWQALREELHSAGPRDRDRRSRDGRRDVLRPFIEDAAPQHPSLVDETHRMDALFGVTNIPSWIWIDEDGDHRPPARERRSPARDAPGRGRQPPAVGHGRPLRLRRRPHGDMLRDWVGNGADSEFVLSPAEVVARSHPQSVEVSQAAAHFEAAPTGTAPLAAGRLQRAHAGPLRPGPHPAARQHHLQAPGVLAVPRGDHRRGRRPHPLRPVAGRGRGLAVRADFTTDTAAITARREADAAGLYGVPRSVIWSVVWW